MILIWAFRGYEWPLLPVVYSALTGPRVGGQRRRGQGIGLGTGGGATGPAALRS
jgi:hypothetical protein